MLRAWHKYKEFNFEFTILERCKENELNDREIYWVAHYDAYYNGYNQTKGGDGCLGKIWTDEERENVSKAIFQISLNGEILNRFINIDDAEKQTGVNHRQIWNWLIPCINVIFCKSNVSISSSYTHIKPPVVLGMRLYIFPLRL